MPVHIGQDMPVDALPPTAEAKTPKSKKKSELSGSEALRSKKSMRKAADSSERESKKKSAVAAVTASN